MKVIVKDVNLLEDACDILVVPVASLDKQFGSAIQQLDHALKGHVKLAIEAKELKDKKHAEYSIHTLGNIGAKKVLFIGLGKAENVSLNDIRDAAGNVIRSARYQGAKTVSWINCDSQFSHLKSAQIGTALSEGVTMGHYQFLAHKSEPSTDSVETVSLHADKEGVERGVVLGDATNFARDLSNQPGNVLFPKSYIDIAKQTFKGSSVSVEVIDQKKAEKLGMGGLVGVGKGSVNPPYMLVLSYKGASGDPVALVGKGVTFDTGGISIKPSKGMSGMKADMGGSAAVMGAFRAIDRLKPKTHVLGVIPLAENMPSSVAQKPGDVVTAMNGKTIEIINTDAEGRLILADALCYAVSKNAKAIVDIATLTGAAMVSMGNESAAILGNDSEIIDGFLDRCGDAGEQLWQLPLFDSFLDYLKSDTADIMNAAEGKGGGTCTAAKFLEQFVKKTPWAHIDMAPMMQSPKTSGVLVKGMSGYGVRTLTHFVESIS